MLRTLTPSPSVLATQMDLRERTGVGEGGAAVGAGGVVGSAATGAAVGGAGAVCCDEACCDDVDCAGAWTAAAFCGAASTVACTRLWMVASMFGVGPDAVGFELLLGAPHAMLSPTKTAAELSPATRQSFRRISDCFSKLTGAAGLTVA